MNIFKYFAKNISFFGIGLLFALLINAVSDRLISRFNPNWFWSLGIRMFFTVGLLYLFEEWVSPSFAREWQDTTPGILFTFGMFGGQLFDVQKVGYQVKSLIGIK